MTTTTKHHNLADGVITYTTYDGDGRRLRDVVTNEDHHVMETTAYNGLASIKYQIDQDGYHLDIFNWRNPDPKISRWELGACIEAFPEREVNWPKIAGAMGLKVRAAWHWENDLRFGYDCDMDIFGDKLGERNRYVRTLERGWQRRP